MNTLKFQMKEILHKINQNKCSLPLLLITAWQLGFPGSHAYAMSIPPMIHTPMETVEPIVVEPPVEVLYTQKVPITAYNSLEGQTDSTPCLTANGYDLCENNEENVIAANFLKFGTKVRIPELFGDRIFTVQDRMNKRYYYRVDVWMKEYSDARKFGLKTATVEIIK